MEQQNKLKESTIRFFHDLFDLLLVNCLWLMCCLPVVTIGPATCGMYAVTLKLAREEPVNPLKDFLRGLRDNFKAGVTAAMEIINKHYVADSQKISDDEITAYVDAVAAGLAINAKEAINTQAWILHFTNPSEAWANLRRSDYPVIMDRALLNKFDGFIYDDPNMSTPTRLKYPVLESKYNTANYNEAIQRLGGKDDWHARLWWDTADINVK